MICAIVGILAPSQAQAALVLDETVASAEPRRIAVERDDYICASVKVSAETVEVSSEIWPKDVWDTSLGSGLSSYLVNRLRVEFREIGRMGRNVRFRTNDNGRDPFCSGNATTFINISYRYRGKDALLFVAVDVIQGDVKMTSTHVMDVDDEMKSRRLFVSHGENAIQNAIFEDIRRSAGAIVADNLLVH